MEKYFLQISIILTASINFSKQAISVLQIYKLFDKINNVKVKLGIYTYKYN